MAKMDNNLEANKHCVSTFVYECYGTMALDTKPLTFSSGHGTGVITVKWY